MTKIIIHRGTYSIGGNCVEFVKGDDRLILDLGTPLMGRNGEELEQEALQSPSVDNGILPDIRGLYSQQLPSVNALILSHSHLDHCGLIDMVHPNIPIYLSKGTQVPKRTCLHEGFKAFD